MLIVRMGALGDIVHALPVLAALRAASARRARRLAGGRALRRRARRSSTAWPGVVVVRAKDDAADERAVRFAGVAGMGRALAFLRAPGLRGGDRPAGAHQVGGLRPRLGRRPRARLRAPRAARAGGGLLLPRAGASGRPRARRAQEPRDARAARRAVGRRDVSVDGVAVGGGRRRWRPTRAGRRPAASCCSIRARRGRTSAGRPNTSAPWPAALGERHGLPSVVTWGPGEQARADAVVARAGGARRSPRRRRRCTTCWRWRARRGCCVSGDTGPAASGGVGRHADRRPLRADAPRTQRPVARRRRGRVARRRVRVLPQTAVPARAGLHRSHRRRRGARRLHAAARPPGGLA